MNTIVRVDRGVEATPFRDADATRLIAAEELEELEGLPAHRSQPTQSLARPFPRSMGIYRLRELINGKAVWYARNEHGRVADIYVVPPGIEEDRAVDKLATMIYGEDIECFGRPFEIIYGDLVGSRLEQPPARRRRATSERSVVAPRSRPRLSVRG